MMAFPFTSRTHYLSDFQSDNRQATKQHKRMAYIQTEECSTFISASYLLHDLFIINRD